MGGKPRRSRAPLGLAAPWRRWVLDALLADAPVARILEELVASGVPPGIAAHELDVIAVATTTARVRLRRLELSARLLARLTAEPLERTQLVPADAFFARYLAANRPVVFVDGCRQLATAGALAPERLAEVFGEVEVTVCAERDSRPDHYVDASRNSRSMRLRELVQQMRRGPSNDLYLVSQNRALEGPLASLVDEIGALPDFLDPAELLGRVSLWLGPAGTLTPLHHDTTNVYFCQLTGRKRFHLIAPLEAEVLLGATHDTFYSGFDPQAPGELPVHVVELAPGEALFIPVGWWHQVEALDASVSLSFTCFRRPNTFEWYRPGAIEHARVRR